MNKTETTRVSAAAASILMACAMCVAAQSEMTTEIEVVREKEVRGMKQPS